jgi:hypothetical protein
MPWEERRVQVESAVAPVEEGRRDELPVVGEDDELGIEVEDGGESLGVTQAGGRQDVQAQLAGLVVDGGRCLDLAAADGPRWRGDDPDDLDRGMAGKPAEDRLGEASAAEEEGPDRCSFAGSAGRTGD